MAHHKSAIKRIKTNEIRRQRNRAYTSRMRKEIKGFEALLTAESVEEAKAALPKLVSRITKSASKGVINKKTASRKISRLSLALNKLSK